MCTFAGSRHTCFLLTGGPFPSCPAPHSRPACALVGSLAGFCLCFPFPLFLVYIWVRATVQPCGTRRPATQVEVGGGRPQSGWRYPGVLRDERGRCMIEGSDSRHGGHAMAGARGRAATCRDLGPRSRTGDLHGHARSGITCSALGHIIIRTVYYHARSYSIGYSSLVRVFFRTGCNAME